jgi:alpha-amylase/alpha-mannosidase (GH57 family)
MPHVVLPHSALRYPEDFDYQVEQGKRIFRQAFGHTPRGMWPSEGSVSDAAVRRLLQHDIAWVASDEAVLARSRLARGLSPDPRQAYRVEDGERELAMIFRNQRLSDLIGFTYMHWDPTAAADDFIREVLRAAQGADPDADRPPLVAVILDGENCWEHYPEDGIFFLRALYGRLSRDPRIEAVTVSEYLERYPPVRTIDHVFAGSWIHHDFSIWIGHPEDNAAWDLLATTRAAIERRTPEGWSMERAAAAGEEAGATTGDDDTGHGRNADAVEWSALAQAWRHLYIAEGSDWFWWYGDEHWCDHLDVFDQLFRGHLTAAYDALGEDAPPECLRAIKGRFGRPPSSEQVPVRFINPIIDGRVTHFYEWKLAGQVDANLNGATMRIGARELTHLHYGFDLEHLYLRVDGVEKFSQSSSEASRALCVDVSRPERLRLELDLVPADGRGRTPRLLRYDGNAFTGVETGALCAVRDVVEIQLPFRELSVHHGDTIELAVILIHEGRTVEALPAHGPLVFRAPDPDFEATMWSAS